MGDEVVENIEEVAFWDLVTAVLMPRTKSHRRQKRKMNHEEREREGVKNEEEVLSESENERTGKMKTARLREGRGNSTQL